MQSVTNTPMMQWIINKCRSYYYPILYGNFEANEIIPGLWLGSFESACDKTALEERNIKSIVTVVYNINPIFKDLTYYKVPIIDTENSNINKYFDECIDFIDESLKKGSVLVHCIRGISRSSTIVCAYLIKKLGYSCQHAIKTICEKRPQAFPNEGFLSQLDTFEKSLSYVDNFLSIHDNLEYNTGFPWYM